MNGSVENSQSSITIKVGRRNETLPYISKSDQNHNKNAKETQHIHRIHINEDMHIFPEKECLLISSSQRKRYSRC